MTRLLIYNTVAWCVVERLHFGDELEPSFFGYEGLFLKSRYKSVTRIFKSGHPQVMRGNSGIDKLLNISPWCMVAW